MIIHREIISIVQHLTSNFVTRLKNSQSGPMAKIACGVENADNKVRKFQQGLEKMQASRVQIDIPTLFKQYNDNDQLHPNR